MSAEAELGAMNSALGYALVSMAKADATLLLRNESFPYSIDYLKEAGWSDLRTIYTDDFDDGSGRHVLVYVLVSERAIHKTIAVQVIINSRFPWYSLAQVFETAGQKESYLRDHHGITFSKSAETVKNSGNVEVAGFPAANRSAI